LLQSPNLDLSKTSPILSTIQTQKQILRIKRKYLRLKGFFRKYKNFQIQVDFANTNVHYNPIQIQYKKIDLFFKHRPPVYYYAEMDQKTLEFIVINDVDLLFFPYKTAFDYKILPLI